MPINCIKKSHDTESLHVTLSCKSQITIKDNQVYEFSGKVILKIECERTRTFSARLQIFVRRL